jgi:hypothetical protein
MLGGVSSHCGLGEERTGVDMLVPNFATRCARRVWQSCKLGGGRGRGQNVLLLISSQGPLGGVGSYYELREEKRLG